MTKFFVIGFNKTATSTFHKLFLTNDLKSQHDTVWKVNDFDCFSDNGNLNNFKQLDKDYPNSIFILNTRSLDKWLISRFQHGVTENKMNGLETNWAYPCSNKLCNEWINERETYYLDVLNYFKNNPNKLIIVNTENDNWLQFISSKLGFTVDWVKSENISDKNTQTQAFIKITKIVDGAFAELNYNDKEKTNILFRNNSKTKKYLKIYSNNIL